MVTNEMVKNWHSDMGKLRVAAVQENINNFILTTVSDAFIGMIAAGILCCLLQYLVIPAVYEIFANTTSITGMSKGIYTLEEIKTNIDIQGIAPMIIRILDKVRWLQTWLVLFGIRFIINYLTHGFNDIHVTGNAKKA